MNILFAGTYNNEQKAEIDKASIGHSIEFSNDQASAISLIKSGMCDLAIVDWVINQNEHGGEVNSFDLIREALASKAKLVVRGQVGDTELQRVLESVFDTSITVILGKEKRIEPRSWSIEGY